MSAAPLNIESTATTKYDALLLSYQKRFSSRGQFNFAYTLSKALNYSNDDQIPFTHGPIDPNNLRLEYGPTPNDQRHRFVLSGTAPLPWRIQFSPIWTIASGVPMDILMPDSSQRVPLLGRNVGGRQFHSKVPRSQVKWQQSTTSGERNRAGRICRAS